MPANYPFEGRSLRPFCLHVRTSAEAVDSPTSLIVGLPRGFLEKIASPRQIQGT